MGSAGSAGAGGTGSSGVDAPDGGTRVGVEPQPPDPVALPDGSREVDGVVNLVSPEAAQELEDFMVIDHGPRPIWDEHDLNVSLNLFLEHYEELYDFVYLFTDHELETNFAGKFQAVTRTPQVGTGNELQISAEGYRTDGTVKGVLGIQYFAGRYGPLAHEVLHYWANHLDPVFGFGETAGDPHWGFSGIHGQLGGFEQSTLACETPAGAFPPDCEPLPGGRYRYVVDSFAPNANGPDMPMAPLELYMMGVLPLSQVPPEITVLDAALQVPDSYDLETGTELVEADGMHVVDVTEIVARHGEVPEWPASERALRAAFVVVSAEPAADSVMADVAHWAAVFGSRVNDPSMKSFQELSGGLVTLDTRLGPRRSSTAATPQVRPPATCDVLAQDCMPAGTACHMAGQRTLCTTSLGFERDEPCETSTQCAPGLECVTPGDSGEWFCEPVCEVFDETSPIFCDNLCTNVIYLGIADGELIVGQCFPD